jgi:hypothetical protein
MQKLGSINTAALGKSLRQSDDFTHVRSQTLSGPIVAFTSKRFTLVFF